MSTLQSSPRVGNRQITPMSHSGTGVLPVVQGSMTGETAVLQNRRRRGVKHAVLAASVAALAAFVASPPAAAQTCVPAWQPTFGDAPGIDGGSNGRVEAMTVFDDGTGPALYVGGQILTAGGATATNIAKWNGQSWSPVGVGIGSTAVLTRGVLALCTFDDGTGPALYAGGKFNGAGAVGANNIAKWDGASWSPLGNGIVGGSFPGTSVSALRVFDDGTGPALYIGGHFTTAGGVPASNIAKWDGQSWSPLGGGLSGMDGNGFVIEVSSLTVFNDGTGAALYAAGIFTTAGGVAVSNIAKWNGSTWASVGGGVNGAAGALTIFNDGSGPALFVGGKFTVAGGVPASHVAKWDGASWSPLGSGLNAGASMTVFDDGTGAALYASGSFTTAGGVAASRIAKWDGASWSPLGSGLHNSASSILLISAGALAVFDDGSGPSLFVGGKFPQAGNITANNVASWSGQSWSGVGDGMNNSVIDMVVFNDGTGAALYAGGGFTLATGGVAASHIAKWDGLSWESVGGGLNGLAVSLVVFDDGTGPALYAGGFFTTAGGVAASSIAKWDGLTWSPLGSGISGGVNALTVFDDGGGSALYVGGFFTTAGGVPAGNIAKWDGSAWAPVGSALNGGVVSLSVFNDGTGPALYAGGGFSFPEGFAKLNGHSWLSVGGGLTGEPGDAHGGPPISAVVESMAVFDGGSGPLLYVSGHFFTAGGVPVTGLATWDGLSWAPIAPGSGLPGGVRSMKVFDDGSGAALYFDGRVRWDGSSWTTVATGVLGSGVGGRVVFSMVGFDDGSGPSLFVGGNFLTSPAGDSFLAKYQGCSPPPPPNPADTNGDGVVNGADLANLLTNWGPCLSGGACRTDLNSDGAVDAADLAFLLSNWG